MAATNYGVSAVCWTFAKNVTSNIRQPDSQTLQGMYIVTIQK